MKQILLDVPDSMKRQLDAKRAEGYSIAGFCRAAIQAALAEHPRKRTGKIAIAYRRPGEKWNRRTIPAKRLEGTVLKLESQGAEIVTREK